MQNPTGHPTLRQYGVSSSDAFSTIGFVLRSELLGTEH
jgi:hypothetical protein